jgi:hypothetical protein
LHLPNSRKSRSDGLADWIRTAVVKWWTDKTRITACTKNVVVRDGLEYPVHWLEDTIERFYEQFLNSSPDHYYTNQLVVRGHGCEDVSRSAMFAAFKPFHPVRTEKTSPKDKPASEKPKKYYFVKFKTEHDRDAALAAAAGSDFKIQGVLLKVPYL